MYTNTHALQVLWKLMVVLVLCEGYIHTHTHTQTLKMHFM